MRKLIALACFTALVVAGVGTASAAGLFTGKDVKNHSLTGRDIKRRSIPLSALNRGTQKLIKAHSVGGGTTPASQGEAGGVGPQGLAGQNGASGSNAAGVVGPHWGVIDRNTIKFGVAELRTGPFVPGSNGTPPFGDGSLNIQTGDNASKVEFGNEVDFAGDPVSGLSAVGFRVYTTGENHDKFADNMPNIEFEVDKNGGTLNPGEYSTLVFVTADSSTPNQWSGFIDATDGTVGKWYLTGSAGTDSGCTQGSMCTLAEVQTALPTATILSAGVGKGRDYEWEGAIDGLRINNEVFDFESYGVNTLAP
jgi:hypothetical protein